MCSSERTIKFKRNILVALPIFCLVSNASIVVATGYVPEHVYQQNSVIEICKLIKHPSQYAEKTIRLQAVLVENHTPRVDGGDSYLYGPACRKAAFTVLVEFSSQESYRPLEIFSEKPDVHGYVRASVILVGALQYSGTQKYGHLDWADSQFVVYKVEEVRATPTKTPWRR